MASPGLRTAGNRGAGGDAPGEREVGSPRPGEGPGTPREGLGRRLRRPAREALGSGTGPETGGKGGAKITGNPGPGAKPAGEGSVRPPPGPRDPGSRGARPPDPRGPTGRPQRIPAPTHHVKREGQAEQKEPQVEVERVHEGGLVRVVVPAAAQRGPHPLPEDLQRLRPHPHPASPPPPPPSPPRPQLRPRRLRARGPV